MLAGVSAPYYTRLEQGRDRHPSPQILEALAHALELDEDATAHMQRLVQAASRPRRRSRRSEHVTPGLQHLLERWTGEPAVVIGRYRDVLAANRLAQILNPGFVPGRNLLHHTFLDPGGRDYYIDWEEIAQGAVAGLRASAGADMDDPRLTEIVGELSLKSDEFRRMWARHDVRERATGRKRYNNPFVGPIALGYESFAVNGHPGQTLFVFHAEPGSRDQQSLALLAGIANNERGSTPQSLPADHP
jgi:transcriptional regulator with XRE-family HTH domain